MMPASSAADCFSADYASARARFRAAAEDAGAILHTLALDAKGPEGADLTINIACLGRPDARRFLIHSSGLHGVEAFTGSAVQLALLAQPPEVPSDCALVLVHDRTPRAVE